jgi:multicomponent Na+:H+ antiporter subunit G
MSVADWISAGLIAAGLFFFVAGTVGLLRLPDPLSRLHALTKADNLGLLLVALGVVVHNPEPFLALKLLLIWMLVMAAGATGAHLIAKRAVRGDGEDAR